MKPIVFLSFLSLAVLSGCIIVEPDAELTLQDVVNQRPDLIQSDELIACAAGGQADFLDDPAFPTSIFFYPLDGASDFRYFESKTIDIDPNDLSNFTELFLAGEPVFNGKLWRFLRAPTTEDSWGRVTFLLNDKIHISAPIRLKLTSKPTEYAPEKVSIDQSSPQEPLFMWEDGQIQENAIWFHVVSDENGNLISGTYTYERLFQFYDLSNVVLNIHDITPAPTLQAGSSYNFTLMGVSEDNWVNLIAETSFDSP